jgi:putative ABC transport system permease protein
MTGTAILTGALLVGDSVRHSLGMMAASRLGRTNLALVANNRFFSTALADKLEEELNTNTAPVLYLRGIVANSDGTKRVNKIDVLGVDNRFFTIGANKSPLGEDITEGIVLNDSLAERLDVTVGDEVVLRIEQPALISRDIPITPASDLSLASRLVVKAVAGASEFGRFSLKANQIPALNAFVPIQWLQEKIDRPKQANILLVAGDKSHTVTAEKANEAVKKCWQLGDAGLELRKLEKQNAFELRSRRIFIDEPFPEAAMNTKDKAVGILTYFVNELRFGDKSTPYSMVTAIANSADSNNFIPMDIEDNEIIINQWLADDLGAKVGDLLELAYFVVSPMRKLDEEKSTFKIGRIIPMLGPAIDPDLMPDFPGLADANDCRDWDKSIPIDLDRIRKDDEDYWYKFKGTPKAFITLKAGQAIWANRYGNLTAVRYRLSDKPGEQICESITAKILREVDPASVGLYFQPVRARGIKAGNEATDFGQLFLGFSFFLIIAALVLMSLIFVFGVEKRSEQVGMLLAVGFPPKLVRRLLFTEGGTLALIGALAGTAAGLLYTRAMIYGLATIWRVAVSGSAIQFYAKSSTLLTGAFAAVAICLITIWLTLRKQVSRPARELLVGELKWQFFEAVPIKKKRLSLWIAAVTSVAAAGLVAFMTAAEGSAAAGAFFGAGALILISGLALIQFFLRTLKDTWNKPLTSLTGLGLRNATRRSGRSLAVAALLACGIFLVIAVGANRHNPLKNAHRRDSGTGGFAIFGESAIGIVHDLNSKNGRQSTGLDDRRLDNANIIQLRLHEGDDASCLNLNRAQTPSLLGVQPEQIRGAFRFTDIIEGAGQYDGWLLLNHNPQANVVPAIGDYATVVWALGKSVGDELAFCDEMGRTFRLRIVAMVKNSILQGYLVISEDEFVRRFPSENGYRIFLIDTPPGEADKMMDILSAALTDYGLALTATTQRLADFSAVENTYLSIFQLLGGLGLILGSIGLGLVVLRNVLDRRGELAMMQAVGINKIALKRMILYEHGALGLCGLSCGIIAAIVAVGPALSSAAANVPYLSLALIILAIGISGLAWIWMATTFALSGKLLDALRNE